MTGFGAAPLPAGRVEASLEIRSVNGRHLKLNIRLPSGLEEAEAGLRDLIAGALRRGTVDVALRSESTAGSSSTIEIDEDRLRAVLAAYRKIGERFGVPGEVDLALVVRTDRVLVERVPRLAELVDRGALLETAEAAVAQVVRMREAEGERIAEDFRDRLAVIGERLAVVESRAPERLERERERLGAAVAELTADTRFDDDRIAREIALLADRWDMGEELLRARSHLEAFEDLLNAPGDEPVGKRLGFLGQELLREVNTIGSKANDATIQHEVVEMKNEIETLREQIENIE